MPANTASLKALHKARYRQVRRLPGRYRKRGQYRHPIHMAAQRDSSTP